MDDMKIDSAKTLLLLIGLLLLFIVRLGVHGIFMVLEWAFEGNDLAIRIIKAVKRYFSILPVPDGKDFFSHALDVVKTRAFKVGMICMVIFYYSAPRLLPGAADAAFWIFIACKNVVINAEAEIQKIPYGFSPLSRLRPFLKKR